MYFCFHLSPIIITSLTPASTRGYRLNQVCSAATIYSFTIYLSALPEETQGCNETIKRTDNFPEVINIQPLL